ncbi:MAG TPA: hypothetical protein VGX27_11930 [Candidatus Dormibacteraeota bacterium]|nr:hypothetical protein [Candidatus Dormibacteraeota bacterium]
MRRSLAIILLAYVVCDVLLTPPVHLETRDPAKVTAIGIAGLALLFVGLALSIVALVLLLRGSKRSPVVAIIGAALYVPAFLSEQTGHFSSLRAPAAIEFVEWVQFVVVIIAIGLSLLLLRRRGLKV